MNMNKLSTIRYRDSLRSSPIILRFAPVILSEAKDLVLSSTSFVHIHYRAQ